MVPDTTCVPSPRIKLEWERNGKMATICWPEILPEALTLPENLGLKGAVEKTILRCLENGIKDITFEITYQPNRPSMRYKCVFLKEPFKEFADCQSDLLTV
jgi:hypothetical protein